MSKKMKNQMIATDKPTVDPSTHEALFKAPVHDGKPTGSYEGKVLKHSTYSFFSQRPSLVVGLLSVGLGVFFAAFFGAARRVRDSVDEAVLDELAQKLEPELGEIGGELLQAVPRNAA